MRALRRAVRRRRPKASADIVDGDVSEEASELKSRVSAIKELLEAFKFERAVYMAITLLSLFVLLACATSLIASSREGMAEAVGLFGASGAITYTTGRLLKMWSDAIRILAKQPAEDDDG